MRRIFSQFRTGLLVVAALLAAGGPLHAEDLLDGLEDVGQGSKNSALIIQEGPRQRAEIKQNNIGGGLLNGAIQQYGSENNANLLMEGSNLTGQILQDGNNNEATLILRGEDNTGGITQQGDNNKGTLTIEGQYHDVQLQQFGNNNEHPGITVSGEGTPGMPAIVITQSPQ